MWYAYIDAKDQKFIIEDREGNIISEMGMPNRRYPNPGKDELMSYEDNRVAWSKICSLVEAANRGKSK